MTSIQTSKPKKGWGVIYLITCIPNGKRYIGQAANYVSGNVPWGCAGRWKSHLNEAYGNKKDHCRLLNNAIRKYTKIYGKDCFMCHAIIEVPERELNDLEQCLIEDLHTLAPNGYNLTKGGSHFKASDETRKKQSIARTGVKRTKSAAYASAVGQLGKIRRKHQHGDEHLNQYIDSLRDNENKIVGYKVVRYPTYKYGSSARKYATRTFMNTTNPDAALNNANKFIAELIEKYGDHQAIAKKMHDELTVGRVKKSVYERFLVRCDKYMYPIINSENKIAGYCIEGIPNATGGTYPKEVFNTRAATRDKKAAKRRIKELEMLTNDLPFYKHENEFDIDVDDLYEGEKIRGKDNPQLPPHIAYEKSITKKTLDGVTGYKVNNYIMKDGTPIQRKFCSKNITMKEKFILAITYLRKLIQQDKK